jgi:tetratricopeptide (TPR) repeat protein
MALVPEDPAERVDELIQEGEVLLDEYDQEEQALVCFQEAWALLPEPKEEHSLASNILAAMGDCHFFLGRWEEAHRIFQRIIKTFDGMQTNPFVRMRLGQCLFELRNLSEACNWMVPVYLGEGSNFFESEDPKYVAYLKEHLDPPPGGWPEGY